MDRASELDCGARHQAASRYRAACTHFTFDAPAAGVVTGSAVDWAEWLPAVSKASTVYEYAVDGATVESVNVVVVALAMPIEVPLRYTV